MSCIKYVEYLDYVTFWFKRRYIKEYVSNYATSKLKVVETN